MIDNGDVVLEVDEAGWRIRWGDAGVTLRSAAATRSWTIAEAPDGTDVTVVDDGGHLTLRVPTTGPVVEATFRAVVPAARLVALDAVVEIDPERSTRLVNGYQSWDYAGARPATEEGLTWWGGALAVRDGGSGLAYHAATAGWWATSFSTAAERGEVRLTAFCGGAPEAKYVESWGFVAPDPVPLPQTAARQEAEPILLAAAADPLAATELVADGAGRASGALRWTGDPITGWESWYHYGFSITPETLLANGRVMRERFANHEGFRLVQLDDGWQRAYGDWRPGDGWPDDLGEIARSIRALGCTPGLWLAPFMVKPGASDVGQRPELLIGDPAGDAPRSDPRSGRYGVDATHPEAIDWLADLGARVRAWGFAMVKLDFLYIGALEGLRHDPTVSGTSALRRGLAAFLEGLGDGVYVLACGAPMLPVTGLCHGNRTGGDVSAPIIWPFPGLEPFPRDEGWRGILPQARNTAARWWCHRRLYDIDPDVVMAAGPEDGPPYTVEDVQALATVAALCGGPYFLADDLAALTAPKRAVLEDPWLARTAWSEGARPEDLFEHPDEADPGRFHFYSLPTALPRRWVGREAAAEFDPGPPLRVVRRSGP